MHTADTTSSNLTIYGPSSLTRVLLFSTEPGIALNTNGCGTKKLKINYKFVVLKMKRSILEEQWREIRFEKMGTKWRRLGGQKRALTSIGMVQEWLRG